MRRLLKSKHDEDTGYLGEGVVGLAETVLELDAEQDQADLYPLGVPARAVRRSGYVWVLNMLIGKARHIRASRLSEVVSPDGVRFSVSLTEYLRENG